MGDGRRAKGSRTGFYDLMSKSIARELTCPLLDRSPYGPNPLGYTRRTTHATMGCDPERGSETEWRNINLKYYKLNNDLYEVRVG